MVTGPAGDSSHALHVTATYSCRYGVENTKTAPALVAHDYASLVLGRARLITKQQQPASSEPANAWKVSSKSSISDRLSMTPETSATATGGKPTFVKMKGLSAERDVRALLKSVDDSVPEVNKCGR